MSARDVTKVVGPPKKKPLLRGVSHEIGAYLAAIAAVALVIVAPTGTAAWGAGIYGASLVALLGISALYHRPTWTPRARQRMRKLDHSAIFILIAGTYTPLCLLVLGPSDGLLLLVLVWAGACLGICQSLFWASAPKPLVAGLCVALGWLAVWHWRAFAAGLSASALILMGVGGVLYTSGAVIYALRRPDPFPRVFGYHEIFHILVVAAAVCHFIAVTTVVLAA